MVSSLIDFFFQWNLTCWLAESCKEHGDQRGEGVAAEHKGESTNVYGWWKYKLTNSLEWYIYKFANPYDWYKY